MKRAHVKKGDEVVVISGSQRGKRGKIISVVAAGDRVIVEGCNIIKKHVKKNSQHPEGAIVEREGSLHISNVCQAGVFDSRKNSSGVANT